MGKQPMNDDTQLLRDYIQDGSESAFRSLVDRHIALVHAAARRVAAGDAHLAQDVTQLVFTDLARKAQSLPPGVVLAGWLHRHTCFTAAKVVRTESRRRARERIAMEINALNEAPVLDAQWRRLAPVLDEALNSLAAADRDAIALRFLERRDLRSIGAALGTNDDAAQKRIVRALDRLRDYLTQRGLTFSAVLLATALEAGAASACVPAGLAASVSVTALSTASTPTLATLLKTMITSKYTIGFAALAVLTGVTTALIGQNKTPDADSKVPVQQVATVPTTPVEKKPEAAVTPALAPEKKSQSVTVGAVPANLPPGAFSSSSSVRMKGNTMIITTTENGVTKTETREIPAAGAAVTTAHESGESHFSVSKSAPGEKAGGYAVTTVIDKDGHMESKRTDFAPDANGQVHAGATVSAGQTDPATGQAIVVHDHTPPEAKAEPAPASAAK